MPRKSSKKATSTSDALLKQYAEKQNSIKEQRKLTKALTDDLKGLEQQLINNYNVPDGEITTLEGKDYTIQINRMKKRKALTAKQIVGLINEHLGDDTEAQTLLEQIEAGGGERESLQVAVRSRAK